MATDQNENGGLPLTASRDHVDRKGAVAREDAALSSLHQGSVIPHTFVAKGVEEEGAVLDDVSPLPYDAGEPAVQATQPPPPSSASTSEFNISVVETAAPTPAEVMSTPPIGDTASPDLDETGAAPTISAAEMAPAPFSVPAPPVGTQAASTKPTSPQDPLVLSVADVSGTEDSAIALDIAVTSPDAMSVVITGVPEGATLSVGLDNSDGTWMLTPEELFGLTLTPPEAFNGEIDLTVTATAVDGTDVASVTDGFTVFVEAEGGGSGGYVRYPPGLKIAGIPITIIAAVPDPHLVTISGHPPGAIFSAGEDNGDGTWTLLAEEMEGCRSPPR